MSKLLRFAVLGSLAFVSCVLAIGCSTSESGEGASGGAGGAEPDAIPVRFEVTLRSDAEATFLVDDMPTSPIFAPRIWLVHRSADPLFVQGELDRGIGLEALAEDGEPSELLENAPDQDWVGFGSFDLPAGCYRPGVVSPGESFRFKIAGRPGSRLTFAGMFAQSNDVFVAPSSEGIPLFDEDGEPRTGLLNDDIYFWDAGTEENEAPGSGEFQASTQADPDSGPSEMKPVSQVADGFTYPMQFVSVELQVIEE